jgi:hypothetical protein
MAMITTAATIKDGHLRRLSMMKPWGRIRR